MPRKKKPHLTEEDIALEVSEEKRLVRLGIDPDADPLDILEQLRKDAAEDAAEDAREEELKKQKAKQKE